jgi:hypothetical protein
MNQSAPFQITGIVLSDILVDLDVTGSSDQIFNAIVYRNMNEILHQVSARTDFLWPHPMYTICINDANDASLTTK